MREIVPGIFQIETKLGDNWLYLYLLCGQRALLVDSGVADTPGAVIFPALAAAGLPRRVDYLLVSHADADHHGGNGAVRAQAPAVTILAHELDRARVESKARHLAGRYLEVVGADDVRYEAGLMDWLAGVIGPDTPVDVGLRGGETLWLGDGLRVEVLHIAGHTAGSLAVWQPEAGVLIIQDALLGRGVPDREGRVPSPPPYYDWASYVASIRQAQSLNPRWLLTAHYPVMCGGEVAAFLAGCLAFVDEVDAAVLDVLGEARRPLTLRGVIEGVDARLGPFAAQIQWVGPCLAHLARHVAEGRVYERPGPGGRTWELA